VCPNSSYGAYTSTTNPPFSLQVFGTTNTIIASGTPIEMTLESSNIYWASGAATSYLYVLAWEDNI